MKTSQLRFSLPEIRAIPPTPGVNFVGQHYVGVQAINVDCQHVPSTPRGVADIEPGDLVTNAYMYGGDDAGMIVKTEGDTKATFHWAQKPRTIGGAAVRPMIDDFISIPRYFHPLSLKDWEVATSVVVGETTLPLSQDFTQFAAALMLRTAIAPFDSGMAFFLAPKASDQTRLLVQELLENFISSDGTKIVPDTRLSSIKAALDARLQLADVTYKETAVRYTPPTRRMWWRYMIERLNNAE